MRWKITDKRIITNLKINRFFFKNIILLLSLIAICCFTLSLVLPAINNNVNNPNMIVYFNADEGGQMDIIWSYYSGEKRESFQWDFDYGLEMLYLADFARLVLSRFIHFTPGTFVLILRWINLIAWIFSFFALWHLVSYHFGSRWQPGLAVLFLAVRPAFAGFLNNLKPEPLVLLPIIIGLNYALRIIENPFKKRNLIIAVACASVAFLIKYAGLFLLPAIVASMYFAKRYQEKINGKIVFPTLKISWIFPLLVGIILIIFPLIFILFYVRHSTGFTWHEQYGFWGSLMQNKFAVVIYIAGVFLILLSFIILFLGKTKNNFLKKVIAWVNELNSLSLIICSIFVGFLLLFGFRWIITPMHFVNIYAQFGPTLSTTDIITMIVQKGFLISFFHNIIEKISMIDPYIFIVFIFYLGIEIYNIRNRSRNNLLKLFKRFVVLTFLVTGFIVMSSMLRIGQHHVLPFFVAMSILSIQGLDIFKATLRDKKLFKSAVIIAISALFMFDISINAAKTVKSRIYQFFQHEDVVFDIIEWWNKNIPKDAKIAAEHYIRVYVPPGYKDLKTCPWNPQDTQDRVANLRKFVNIHHPQFVYYNEGSSGGDESMPPVEEILIGKKVKLIKSFDSAGRKYQRCPGDKFFIYEILY